MPQAFCSRHGLVFGAYTVWLIRGCMLILSPVAWPLSFVLDKVTTVMAAVCLSNASCGLSSWCNSH